MNKEDVLYSRKEFLNLPALNGMANIVYKIYNWYDHDKPHTEKRNSKMNIIQKLFKRQGWQTIWQTTGYWSIKNYDPFGIERDFYTSDVSYFKILQKGSKYKLKVRGHKPEKHPMYEEIFRMYRRVVEGTTIIKGGEFYDS